MKTEPSLEYAETPRLAIWTAVAIAFGLLLHRVFFLVALMIALLTPFNNCLARGGAFTECAKLARPAGLASCDARIPCRPDYLCARTPGGGSACLPPYFVLQMRVDGHPGSIR